MKTWKYIWMVSLVTVLSALNLKAQGPITGGIVGGIGTGAVKISQLDSGAVNVIEGRGVQSYSLGVYGKGQFGPFYIRPEVVYNFRNGKVKDDYKSTNFHLHKIEVPLMFGLNFIGPICVEAGPVYNYVLQVTDRYNERDLALTKNGLGYRLGAGLQFDRVFFNLSYQGVTYNAGNNANRTTFKEPYKVALNIGVRLGE